MDSFAALIQKTRSERERKKSRIAQSGFFVRRRDFRKIEEEEYDTEMSRRRHATKKRATQESEDIEREGEYSRASSSPKRQKQEIKTVSKKDRNDKSDKIELQEADRDKTGGERMMPQEVIRRLRALGEPATLFGECDTTRQNRLKDCTRSKHSIRSEHADVALPVGHRVRNVFLQDDRGVPDSGSDEEEGERKKEESISTRKDSSQKLCVAKDSSVEMMCYRFFKKMLREWDRTLQRRPEEVKRSVKGKMASKMQKQCKDYMRSFFKMCKKRSVPSGILDKVVGIVRFCQEREYVKAHSVYMDLAIGRSPWPIGATSVGIHERAARERIQTNKVAHVMNDESARKYITSMKRLMSFCQASYPTDPSKMVMN